MRPIEIDKQLRIRPFAPFQLCMSDGTAYEVRHPEMAVVSQNVVAVAVNPRKTGLPESVYFCDPIHIIRIEPINGRPTRTARSRKQ